MSEPVRSIELLLAQARRLGINVAALVEAAYARGREDGFEDCRAQTVELCEREMTRLEDQFDRLTPQQAAALDRTYGGITATPTAAAYFGSAADQVHQCITRVKRLRASSRDRDSS